MKHFALCCLFSFLFLPYIFLFSLGDFSFVSLDFKVIYHTLLQAFVSSSIAVLFGIIGACGLLHFKRLEFLCLLPSILPSLFVIIALLNVNVPYGFVGIVVAHSALNVGLISFILAQSIKSSCGREIFLAKLYGIPRILVFLKIVLVKIRTQILYIFLTVFAFCVSSFSIPLILGGGKFQVMELLIYELIRFDNNLSGAALVSFYQILLMLLLITTTSNLHVEKNTTFSWDYISFKPFVLIPISITALLFGSVLFDLIGSYKDIFSLGLIQSFIGTVSLSAFTGLLVMLMLAVILFVGESKFLDRVYLSFVAPSTAVIGVSMIVLSYWFDLFLTPIALCLLSIGVLYRLGWSDEIKKYKKQKFLARIYGHSDFSVFRNISWPLSKKVAGKLSGLAAFWAAGDFAVCTILNEKTLGLVAKNLLSSYRFDGVSWIFLLMTFVGVMMYFMFRYVTD